MNQEQKDKVESALIDFIGRTTQNDKTTPEAITVLPNVVSSLAEFDKISPCR